MTSDLSRQFYKKNSRVRKRSDYNRIKKHKNIVKTKSCIVNFAKNHCEGKRLGLIVTKKYGNAVTRNTIKRIVREIFRKNQELFPENRDIVFIFTRKLREIKYRELEIEIKKILKRVQN